MKKNFELRPTLEKIKNNNYALPADIELEELISEMLLEIGNTDPVLRDDLIYTTMERWTVEDKLSQKQHRDILFTLIGDEYLFYNVGEVDTTTVFKRSFSALLIALVLYRNRCSPLLSEDEVKLVYEKIIDYFMKEKDVRGYTEDYGWAHSVAHTADVLGELVLCECLDSTYLLKTLNLIIDKISTSTYVYRDNEDERLVNAIIKILDRNLISQKELESWVDNFAKVNYPKDFINKFHTKINLKNLLRSLYFRILEREEFDFLANKITLTHKDVLNS